MVLRPRVAGVPTVTAAVRNVGYRAVGEGVADIAILNKVRTKFTRQVGTNMGLSMRPQRARAVRRIDSQGARHKERRDEKLNACVGAGACRTQNTKTNRLSIIKCRRSQAVAGYARRRIINAGMALRNRFSTCVSRSTYIIYHTIHTRYTTPQVARPHACMMNECYRGPTKACMSSSMYYHCRYILGAHSRRPCEWSIFSFEPTTMLLRLAGVVCASHASTEGTGELYPQWRLRVYLGCQIGDYNSPVHILPHYVRGRAGFLVGPDETDCTRRQRVQQPGSLRQENGKASRLKCRYRLWVQVMLVDSEAPE
jgi:hypothetical protein